MTTVLDTERESEKAPARNPLNLCRSCGRDFGGVSYFDKHRLGRHSYTYSEGLAMDPTREDGRRCMDDNELEEAGFVRDNRGRYVLAGSAERLREVFREGS